MNILLVGSGGREHALAWKIAQSPLLTRLVIAPGNPGMGALGELRPIKTTDVPVLVALAKEMAADLVVIGPEVAVEAGLADALAPIGVPCFGPSAAAGRLETSKAFAKDFCARHGLPTGAYGVFEAAAPAKAALGRFLPPYVVKADGLASGKGVTVAESRPAAEAAIDGAFSGAFGAAGARVVIEEFLEGEIASQFALCDGKTSLQFGGAQDHKRAFDGEQGPNTGGMGTYSPAPVLTEAVVEQARTRLIEPAFAGIAAEGAPYRGAIFCEMMVTAEGPKLVEFNVRFGDPECQVLMLRLESDIVPYLMAAATGALAAQPPPKWRGDAAICVAVAAKGYPGAALDPNSPIRGLDGVKGEGVVLFHAGTRLGANGDLLSTGGRTLNVCATGATLKVARDRAYAAVEAIDWPGGYCRRDIGWRALGRSDLAPAAAPR